MRTSDQSDAVIRASEIGQYIYCARAWWIGSVQGLPSGHIREMEAGESAHRLHARRVEASVRLSRLAVTLMALAALAAVFGKWQRVGR